MQRDFETDPRVLAPWYCEECTKATIVQHLVTEGWVVAQFEPDDLSSSLVISLIAYA